jgi:hypothetical protein
MRLISWQAQGSASGVCSQAVLALRKATNRRNFNQRGFQHPRGAPQRPSTTEQILRWVFDLAVSGFSTTDA